MSSLSSKQEKSFLICLIILVLVISSEIILSNNDVGLKILIWSIASIVFAVIMGYTFILSSPSSRVTYSGTSHYSSGNSGFKPRITPPSTYRKKSQLKGNCDYCNEPSLLGFTCSYCNGFYCSDHRLPEKHNCSGLRHY